jgi:subtilase family serine protease
MSPFVAHARVTNQGSAPATIFPPNLVVVAQGFSDAQAGPHAIVIPPGESYDVTLYPVADTYEEGLQRWTFTVDPGGHVNESVESNNTYVASVIMNADEGPDADLVLERADVKPAQPRAKEAMFLVLGVRNNGEREILIPTGYQFYEITGPMGRVIPILTQTPERMSSGRTLGMRTVDFAIDTPGEHTLTIRLDPGGLITESDEANNISTMTIRVKE